MLSIIIPFHNEKENLPTLVERLEKVLSDLKVKSEVIFVDDGSNDSYESNFKFQNSNLKLIVQRKQMGKGRALEVGLEESKGDIIVFMDADLQDSPEEIPLFIEKIEKGFDLVNGWRKKRNDPISKTLPSSIFNALLLKPLLNSTFHDINCGFKAMKRDVLEEIPLYGDNYRFLPVLAHQRGFRTTEVEVSHSPRLKGKSKYGFTRIFYGLFDTLTTYFVFKFSEKPLHFFGPIGGVAFVVGSIITVELTIERLFFGVELYKRPLLLAGIFLIIIGLQVILTGVLGELIVFLNKSKLQNPNVKQISKS